MRLLGIGLFSVISAVAAAVPASSAVGLIRQPDGTVIQSRLFGDEFYHWNETDDGYVIMQGPDGWWRYAVKDASGDLAASPQRVGVDARPAGLPRKLRPDDQVVEQKTRQAKAALGYHQAQERPAGAPALQGLENLPPVKAWPSGTVKNLVILCRFSDHTSANHRAAFEYDPLFNQIGYSTDGAAGSVRDYYYEVSYGKLTLQSSIAGTTWVLLPQTEAYYGADSGGITDVNVRQMAIDAINAADAAGVDFSQFDADGDGWIDAIDIIHSGYSQEYSGAPTTYIWSKHASLSNTYAVQKDGVWIGHYHTEPALRGTSGQNITRIGVICHETGHFFGLPDLYDTDQSGSGGYGNGIGAWCLMGSGNWGANGGSWPQRPVHMCVWSKMQMGWIDPIPIHTRANWSILRVEDNPVAYVIREGLPNTEYFLVSNRQAMGFDSNLLNGGGLEILHVDEANLNNNTPYDLKVTFEEADGNWSLMDEASGSRAQAGDPWPGSTGKTRFDGSTTPNTNSNPSLGGSASSISLPLIGMNANPMTFSLQTLIPCVDAPTTAAVGNYNVTWTASASAAQYELQEGTTITATTYSDDCDDEARFRNDWIIQGAARRVVPPGESDSVYLAQVYDPGPPAVWYDEFQSLTLRRKFRVTPSTTISYDVKYGFNGSGKDAYVGYFQIRRTTDASWTTLSKYASNSLLSWSTNSFSSAGSLAPFVGSECEVRFLAITNVGNIWYWSDWPRDGLAIDNFQINNTQLVDYSWTTLGSSAISPYSISKAVPGSWFYRVRPFAVGSWQGWSNTDQVRLVIVQMIITAATVQDLGTATGSDTGPAAALSGFANERSVRLSVTTPGKTPSEIRVAESQSGLTTATYVSFAPPNYDGYLLSDSDGGKDIWIQARNGTEESNPYNIGGPGADILLDRSSPQLSDVAVLDYATLQLTFDEPVRNADQRANYTCTGGLQILAVSPLSATQYLLYTSDQVAATSYTLTVGNAVGDRAGNPINPSGSARSFTGGVKTPARSWRLYR